MKLDDISSTEQDIIKEISTPIMHARNWIIFIGVMLFIMGLIIAYTIVDVVICWIPIWMGILLLQVSEQINIAKRKGIKFNLLLSLSK